MNESSRKVLGMLAAAVLAMQVAPALAQTTANGPYYATPSWDQTLPANTRFIVLSNMNSAAVLDRETGLVWERVPSPSRFDWRFALRHCDFLNTGNRLGWRLPTISELASLIDLSVAPPGPRLPAGHPFTPPSDAMWTANSFPFLSTTAHIGNVQSGLVGGTAQISAELFAWCVRGGPRMDATFRQ